MTSRRRFGSTYRLQLNGFGFAAARDLLPFLSELGVETVYLSPISRARLGSTHGYDVADPAVVDPSLGGRPALDELITAAADRGMSVLLDIVPNHMAAATDNPYFRDVLRLGELSPFASYFDIAWDEHDGRVMLPVLGSPLDEVLAMGELSIATSPAGECELAYFDHRFPLDPSTVAAGATGPVPVREVLDRQHYLLADWRRANRELNYRRFFDINELIGVRQEDPEVFEATHALIVDLLRNSALAGVRVDHVDGLRDPAGYLAALRSAIGDEPIIEVEKILGRDEALRTWPVDGTSGYEFAVAVTGVFIDPDGAAALAADLAAATGDERTFNQRAVEAKRAIIESRFPHLVTQIVDRLAGDLPAADPSTLAAAVTELAVQLTVYRTYRVANGRIDAADRRLLDEAKGAACAHGSASIAAAVDAIVTLFSSEQPATATFDAFARWQQLTPPITAKGVEDTAIYEPGRLLAAADVGSDPDRAAVSTAEFHAAMVARQRSWPLAMSTLSTHDSKRSHDVRCRLAVLSERAAEWRDAVTRIEALAPSTVDPNGPDVTERHYLYETLVGAWPLSGDIDEAFVVRMRDHMRKAGREAKRRSDWMNPDETHEAAVGGFVERLLRDDPDDRRRVLASVASDIEVAGATNALASVVLRAAAPGVPDLYQGDDTWFFALVDPDNRVPLDVPLHRKLLDALPSGPDEADLAALVKEWRDGRLKQYVVRQSLDVRRRCQDFFAAARYECLDAVGRHADCIVAFARRTADCEVICVVPRVSRSLVTADSFPLGHEVWDNTEVVVNGGPWIDRISGHPRTTADGAITVGSLFESLPVALLERC